MQDAAGPRRSGWAFVLALLALVACQAILVFVVIPRLGHGLVPHYGIGFADDYDDLASSLLRGDGYRFFPETAPTLMREPGYPLFLAMVFAVFGQGLVAARLANLVLVFGAGLLTRQLAHRITPDPFVAFAAPLLFVAHPGVLVAELRGGVEILFLFLLVLFLTCFQAAEKTGRPARYLGAGAVLGLTALVRSTPVLFPAVLFARALWTRRDKRRAVARLSLLTGAMLLVMSPWMIRNYRLVGVPVPTASVQGVSAHAGQYICKHLSLRSSFLELDEQAGIERSRLAASLGYRFQGVYYQYFFDSTDELAFNGLLLRRVVNEYLASPALFARCVSGNLLNFWFAGKSWAVTFVNALVQLPYLLAASWGAWLLSRRGSGRLIMPVVSFIAYLMLVHAPIHSQARYSIPVLPLLAILAAQGISGALPSRFGWIRRSMRPAPSRSTSD
jgi:4-amino-4-deoxy-L-arabinose transferase-like glycosyltransferase